MKDTAKKIVKSAIEHMDATRLIFKGLQKPAVSLMTDGVNFYEAVLRPIDRMVEKKHVYQSERVFDLINNAKMDSADACKLVQSGKVDMMGWLPLILNSPALHHFIRDFVSGLNEEEDDS